MICSLFLYKKRESKRVNLIPQKNFQKFFKFLSKSLDIILSQPRQFSLSSN